MFTKPLLLLFASMFLAYANQAILTPAIPLYVSKLGGSASIAGLVLMAFAAPSFMVRPILGKVADRIGHATMLAIGVGALVLAGGVFFAPVLAAVFVASALRGLAWGATNIGGYAYLATAAPPERRGEASGYFAGVLGSASVVFPALALWMINGHGGFAAVFVASCAFAAIAVPTALALRKHDRVQRATETQTAAPPPSTGGVLNRGLAISMALSLCQSLPAPAVIAFLPLFARDQHLGDVGIYYIVAGVLSLLIRPFLGRRSDLLGQGPIIAFGLLAQAIGFSMIWVGSALPFILAGAVIASIGPALIGSATTALALDLAPVDRRGQAMATFTMTFQIGAGFGSVLAGFLADHVGLRAMYLGPLAITLLGAVFLAAVWRQLPPPVRA